MIIVVTGMVGVDKKSYLNRVVDFAAEKGENINLCNVGDMMYAEAPDIPRGKILDIPMKRLSWLRRSVFKDIISQSRDCENLIVNTHATFRWRHGLFPAVDFDQMRQLNADAYINLIDGVAALHSRLTEEHPIIHTLKDLIVWREEEIIGTEMLSKGVSESADFYCLARGMEKETTETFYRLVFKKQRKKAYLSFPITHIVNLPEVRKKVGDFRELMQDYFTCFDPADLEEAYLPAYARQAEKEGKDYIEVNFFDHCVRLQLDQVKQIERDINSQIYARDFMLIDQSDMIISYIPTLPDGSPSISSGVERELQHAHESAKEVYVIWAAEKRPSVFITQTATKVFSTIDEAVEYFKDNGYLEND
jgi:hypothetical protein